jgi:16S rRNA (cytidine1402-2'-O)-methyltransferase
MRRASRGNSAARTTSGASGTGGAHPSGGFEASKPELAPGLYLVATPIGNLADITLRALEVLRGADRVCVEDTRVTLRLLARYGIRRPLEPYHEHNAETARPKILAALRRGERVALVSDAGTPLVSDPGYKLVRAAIAEGITVSAAPGPSAALTALVLSGLPPDAFYFGGFLPPRPAARRRALSACAGLKASLVFFEGPSRLAAALADMAQTLGDRPAAVARELTKLHEEVRRGRLAELAAHYAESGPPRGETVIVVGPAEAASGDLGAVDARLREALEEHGMREAAVMVAAELGLKRRLVYRRALELTRGRQ